MPKKSIVSLGTFDGVHRGHQRILRQVVSRAHRTGSQSIVLAFVMPPRHAGLPSAKPFLLTTLAEKLQQLKKLGVQKVRILVFDRKTASTSPEDFFKQTLLKKCNAREIVVGPRVAFGKNRAGKLPFLKRMGRIHGVRITVVPPVRVRGQAVASRHVRAALDRGRVEQATAFLGYPYSVSGKVVHGRHEGRRLGFPTANIEPDAFKILPKGVFWVKVFPGGNGLCNVGTRPTITPKETRLHCEVFLFHPRGALYGKRLRVVFLRRLRGEKRFASPELLKQQIARDWAQARRWASK